MFAKRLKELRKSKKHLTQKDMAKLLGVARTTYSSYEQGRSIPDSATQNRIADYFDVTLDYLHGRNYSPKWTNNEVKLDQALKSNACIIYGDEEASSEDKEIINDLIAGYFWSKKQKEKNKEG